MSTTVTSPSADDPDWRFDPTNPPDVFTRQMLGRMSIGQLRMCADPATSPLNEKQQASFDAAYAELSHDISERIGSSLQTAMPKLEFTWPATGIDLSTLAPKIDRAFSDRAYEALSESAKASMD